MALVGKSSSRFNLFGPFPRDPNKQALNSWPNYFMTEDATASPQVSPISVTTASVVTLVVPVGAVALQVYSSAALRISDETTAAAHYFVLPASNVVQNIPVMSPDLNPSTGSTNSVYLLADSTTCTVQFMFWCV